MELPELVECLSLALPPEQDHGVQELDGRVRVEAAGARLTAHWSPHTRNCTEKVFRVWGLLRTGNHIHKAVQKKLIILWGLLPTDCHICETAQKLCLKFGDYYPLIATFVKLCRKSV